MLSTLGTIISQAADLMTRVVAVATGIAFAWLTHQFLDGNYNQVVVITIACLGAASTFYVALRNVQNNHYTGLRKAVDLAARGTVLAIATLLVLFAAPIGVMIAVMGGSIAACYLVYLGSIFFIIALYYRAL
jgi:hypothetical protein